LEVFVVKKIGLFLVLGVLAQSAFGMEGPVEQLPEEILMAIFVYDPDLGKDGNALGLEGVEQDKSFVDVRKLLDKEGEVSEKWREAAKKLVSISEGPELVVSVKDRDVKLREDVVIRGLESLLNSHVLFRIIGADKQVLYSCALKPGDLDVGKLKEFVHIFYEGSWKESHQGLLSVAKILLAFVAPIGFYCVRGYLSSLSGKLYDELDCNPDAIGHPNALLDRYLYKLPRVLCNSLSSFKNLVTMGKVLGCISGGKFLDFIEFRYRSDPHFNEHVPMNAWWKVGVRSMKVGLIDFTLPEFMGHKLLWMIFLSKWFPCSGALGIWADRMDKFYFYAVALKRLGVAVRDGYCEGRYMFRVLRAAGKVPSPARFKEIVSDYWTYYRNKNNLI
jgi:hypothetical protein